jgi:pimeloyl-ACP methyl ester carboxylesterase
LTALWRGIRAGEDAVNSGNWTPWRTLSMGVAALVLSMLGPALLAAPAHGRTLGEIEFEPCVLTTAGLPRPTEAQCARVSVPENPADPQGRSIELALAWIPVEGDAEPDPVFMIAGGPGQSARDSYPMVASAFSDLARSRHIMLLDQRGTGESQPLFCEMPEDDGEMFGFDDFSPERARELAEACRDELEEKADLRFYSTAEAVFDLDFVRRAIGAEQVNLVGVSYGTRVAQLFAKTYPERVRTLVLDGVVPMTLALGAEHATNLQSALDRQFARCRDTPACAEALGDPRARLDEVAARLRAGGLEPVRYRDPTSGEWREEVPTYDHFAGILRMYAYQPLSAALLPLIVHQAHEGDYTALLAMVRMMVRDIGGQMATGMHNSVICTEDADELEAQLDDADGTLLGDDFVAFLRATCSVWPRGERPADFRAPLAGDMPVLLVSGEFDPVTPPRYGDAVAAHLGNARHLVLREQGHSLLTAGCMPKLLAQFIEGGDAEELDAACLDRLAAPPPFSGLYGWEP